MSASYQITEPHPSAGKYIHSGRGGAGNTFKAPPTSSPISAQGPASLFGSEIPHSTSNKFSSGRGGAGNIHPSSERSLFSFDEELARQSTRDRKIKEEGVAYHVGRGGAGNWASQKSAAAAAQRKDSSSSADSEGSERRSGFFGRLSHGFDRK